MGLRRRTSPDIRPPSSLPVCDSVLLCGPRAMGVPEHCVGGHLAQVRVPAAPELPSRQVFWDADAARPRRVRVSAARLRRVIGLCKSGDHGSHDLRLNTLLLELYDCAVPSANGPPQLIASGECLSPPLLFPLSLLSSRAPPACVRVMVRVALEAVPVPCASAARLCGDAASCLPVVLGVNSPPPVGCPSSVPVQTRSGVWYCWPLSAWHALGMSDGVLSLRSHWSGG